jgi:hypothetical protein
MSGGPVVREMRPLDEQSFHNRLVAGWSRIIAQIGIAPFALTVRMSKRGVEKVLAGSTPHACTILNSLAEHPTALDEVWAGYGARLVPASAVCSTDSGAGLVMLKAATACVEAEADGVNHQELLAMEAPLRASAAVHARLLARIDDLKAPR